MSAINMNQALDTIEEWVDQRQRHHVCVRDVHKLRLASVTKRSRKFTIKLALVTPDGMPLVWLSRASGFKHVEWVCGSDHMLALCERSQRKGYRHFLYGSVENLLGRLAGNLRTRFPGLQIVGAHAPPFQKLTEDEDERVIRMINAANPEIVWVGLSTPKQERRMAAHVRRLAASGLIGVGAAFDFRAGTKISAPLWMQRSGLERLHRLSSEPG